MKRIIMTMAVAALAVSSVMGQNDLKKSVDAIKAKLEVSDKEVADAKKGSSMKTWESRAKLFVEAAKVNTKGVYASMPASKSEANMFNNLELLMNAPTEKRTEDDMQVWVYPTVEFYIQNDQVQYWKETYVAVPRALDKAAEAYRKTAELDPKNVYKTKPNTMSLIKDLRNTYFNSGLNSYQLKDYDNASKDFAGALGLSDFPRDEKDTLLPDGQFAYYAGLCAFQAGDKATAETMFQKAADLNYEPGSSYHYIYQIKMDDGKEEEAFNIISEAYKKYPKVESILYDVINYYLGKQKYTEAEDYLNTAIKEHPNNLILYNVKASIYVTEYGKNKEQYEKDIEKLSSLKKEAFRNRNNATEKARVETEIEAQEKVVAATKAKYYSNQEKAAAAYNDALKQKSDDYNSLFMLGILEYDKAELVNIEKNAIPLSEDKDGSKSAMKDEEMKVHWKKSCEYFEKAHLADPKEKNPLSNLKMIYYKLGDTANNARVKALLDAM